MAGFETIVRPAVFPNIRPAPARVRAPEDDPDQGKAVISGQSAATITITLSETVSIQRASATENQREFDEVRVYRKGGGGATRRDARAADADNDEFIDVEVVKRIWLQQSSGQKFTRHYAPIEAGGNIVILRPDVVR